MGDVGACDVTENSSPKVEQLVITPFDEGKVHIQLSLATLFIMFFTTKCYLVHVTEPREGSGAYLS